LARRPSAHVRLLDLWARDRPDALLRHRTSPARLDTTWNAPNSRLVWLFDRVPAGAEGDGQGGLVPIWEPAQTPNPLRITVHPRYRLRTGGKRSSTIASGSPFREMLKRVMAPPSHVNAPAAESWP